MKIAYTPIGIIHSPHKQLEGMPIQPAGAEGVTGTVEIYDAFREGLSDLDGFSHIILLYHFHKSRGFDLNVVPFLDDTPRGLFATRAPKRPNPIGISVVRLDRIAGNILHVANVDILDGTPLLDVKPYVREFDPTGDIRIGWLGRVTGTAADKTSDDRFK